MGGGDGLMKSKNRPPGPPSCLSVYAITFRCVDGCRHSFHADYPYTATILVRGKNTAKEILLNGVYTNPGWLPIGWRGCMSGADTDSDHTIRVIAKEREPYTKISKEEEEEVINYDV